MLSTDSAKRFKRINKFPIAKLAWTLEKDTRQAVGHWAYPSLSADVIRFYRQFLSPFANMF